MAGRWPARLWITLCQGMVVLIKQNPVFHLFIIIIVILLSTTLLQAITFNTAGRLRFDTATGNLHIEMTCI